MLKERMSLEGKRVLVTGGTTGIGRATVILLVAEGAHVLTFGRDKKDLAEVVSLAEGGRGKVYGTIADVSSKKELARVFSELDITLGGLDILVACAGIASEPLDEASDDEWRYVIETNLVGYMAAAKAAIDRMKTQEEGGQLVLIGSISAELKSPGESVYATTKAAIQAFAETLRKEVADKNIRVSCIQPGSVESDMQEASAEEQRVAVERHEMLEAEEIAEAVQFIVTRSTRCDVVNLRMEPRLEDYS
jgi:3-hydroxy acid dehydrogenase/malonic semialdehyde reductase